MPVRQSLRVPKIFEKDGYLFFFYSNEHLPIHVHVRRGGEIRFPVRANPRLARGTPAQLRNIEISPFGLHWPDLDEDLSFRGIFGLILGVVGSLLVTAGSHSFFGRACLWGLSVLLVSGGPG